MGWSGRAPAPSVVESARGTEKEHAMSQKSSSAIAVVGIDIEDWIFLQHGPLSAIDRDT